MDDSAFIHLVDVALADATARSGNWLACHPGCAHCCHGVFAISTLDAARLQEGLRTLEETDPGHASRLRTRVEIACESLTDEYPGNPSTGILFEDDASQEAFAEFANEAVCPVLDPVTQQCDLYATRPITCRVYGPPVRTDDGIGICELCFQNAADTDIQAALIELPNPEIEAALTAPLGSERTIIAFALRQRPDAAQGSSSIMK